eukprot:523830-Pyramimonas_sp.AAC.1
MPIDGRIQSGLRVESDALIRVCLKNLLRDNIPVWRSANDIIMTSGIQGRILPSHIVQLIGIMPYCAQCKYDRVGQVWVNELHLEDNERGNLHGPTPVPRECD